MNNEKVPGHIVSCSNVIVKKRQRTS